MQMIWDVRPACLADAIWLSRLAIAVPSLAPTPESISSNIMTGGPALPKSPGCSNLCSGCILILHHLLHYKVINTCISQHCRVHCHCSLHAACSHASQPCQNINTHQLPSQSRQRRLRAFNAVAGVCQNCCGGGLERHHHSCSLTTRRHMTQRPQLLCWPCRQQKLRAAATQDGMSPCKMCRCLGKTASLTGHPPSPRSMHAEGRRHRHKHRHALEVGQMDTEPQ